MTPARRGATTEADREAVRSDGGGAGVGELARLMAAHDDRLSNCVHCGFCLPACPTYTRLGDEADSPRGRLYLMRAVAEGRLNAASEAFQLHIDRCLGCRACETVCPSGVEYGFLLERAREVASRARRPGLATRALLTMIGSPALLTVAMGIGRLLRATGLPGLLARALPAEGIFRGVRISMGMLAASRSWVTSHRLPTPDRRPASGEGERAPVTAAGTAPRSTASDHDVPRPGDRVGILTGCVQAHLFSRVNAATRRVLEANGFEVVDVTGQGCCGALHAHAGHLPAAREMARRNVTAFRERDVDWIVANAAGCGAAMKEYVHLMEDGRSGGEDGRSAADGPAHPGGPHFPDTSGPTGPEVEWLTVRVRDVSELLVAGGRGPRAGTAVPLRVAYDPPCHLLHGQRVDSEPVEMLRAIPELEVLRVPDGAECCGGAGIYGLTHPGLGGRIGADKVSTLLDTEPDLAVTGNPGCAMQIGAGLLMRGSTLRVAHPVELLDESYRRAGYYDD